jgi:hypothetical protein
LDDDQDFGFNGELDGIRIWNRAWTQSEVASNYNQPLSYPAGIFFNNWIFKYLNIFN